MISNDKKNQVIQKHQHQGVNILDPATTYIDEEVEIEAGAVIYPNCCIEGNTKIAKDAVIGMNSKLKNAVIGERSTIESSWVINSEVGSDTTIGPYAHIREHCVIGNKVRIGNFVEMKKTQFGNLSRCAHLSYLGDSIVGEDVNIGCGVVTVNYDGKHKFKTIVKDRAFIGSNANLIAPITIGELAVVAAGSTVNQDVPPGDMGIARSRQTNKQGLGKKYIEKQ